MSGHHRVVLWALAACLLVAPAFAEEDQARFHHVHINAMDPAKSVEFYRKYFSGVAVKYRGKADAVLVDRSFLLFNKVETPAPWELTSAIYHIGWGGVDGPSEYDWRKRAGMEFETPVTALGTRYYMYAWGPDKEVVEIWTGFLHNRFGHVHLFADDVNASTQWYVDHLGLSSRGPRPRPEPDEGRTWSNAVRTGGVTINLFETPRKEGVRWWQYEPIETLVPSKGRAIDHLAYSYTDIDPVFERMKKAGVKIVKPIAMDPVYGFRSFYVMGPDKVLTEIVEEKPLPEGLWD